MSQNELIARLRELEKISITTSSVLRMSAADYAAYNADRISTAKIFAEKINDLANVSRVIDKDAYNEAIADAVGSKNSEDTQFILQYAKSYFREKYSAEIKKRGESPELIDQIIRRLEKVGREEFEKALSGFNCENLVTRLYEITVLTDSEEISTLTKELSELPDHQLSEVIYEFRREHSRRAARIMKNCLGAQNIEVFTLKSLLDNKSPEKIAEIISCYEELFILSAEKNPSTFSDYILSNGGQQLASGLEPFFTGFKPEAVAEQIYWTYTNSDKLYNHLEKIATSTGIAYSALHDLKNISKTELTEIFVRPFINSLVSTLTKEQYQAVAGVLQKSYNISLTEELYICNSKENIFSAYFDLQKSLNNISAAISANAVLMLALYRATVDTLIQPKKAVLNLQSAWVCAAISPLFNLDSENIQLLSKLTEIFSGKTLADCAANIKNINPGSSDLIFSFATLGKEARFKNISDKFEYLISQQNFYGSQELKAIDPDLQAARYYSAIKSALKLNQHEFNLQLLKYIATNTNIDKLEEHFQQKLGAAQFLHLKLFLKGFNAVDYISSDKIEKSFLKLLHCSPLEVAAVLKSINSDSPLSFSGNIQKSKIDALLVHALMKYSEVSAIKTSLDQNKFTDADAQRFIDYYQNSPEELEIFESAFSLLYQTWEFCLEPTFGDYRNSLFSRLQTQQLSRSSFSALILVFEKLPLDLLQQLQYLTRQGEKTMPSLLQLQKIFREHLSKLTIIQKLFFVIDGEKSLRQRIYEFKVLPRDENLTILMLDGYDPVAMAEEVDQAIQSTEGNDLAEKIILLLSGEQQKIPQDHNWQEEIYHQIRIRYEQLTGTKVLADMIAKGVEVNNENLISVGNFLYSNMFQTALKVNQIINSPGTEESLESILDILKILKLSDIERLQDAYLAYFGVNLGEYLISNVQDEITREEITTLFQNAEKWEKVKK